MTTVSYSDRLRHPRWQKKRLQIMERDNWACYHCKKTDVTLNVHHQYYVLGRLPWQYPNDALITLCEVCHGREHEYERLANLIKKYIKDPEFRSKVSVNYLVTNPKKAA